MLALCVLTGTAEHRQAFAQEPAAPVTSGTPSVSASGKLPAYDVVTIRPNKQGPGSVRVSTNLDVYAGTNVSLVDLLNDAYDLRPGMLSGEPNWADSARFDIHAKILDFSVEELKTLKSEDRRRMLRELLASRFGLQAHREAKTLPVYELVTVAGPKSQERIAVTRDASFRGVSNGGTSVHGKDHHYELTAHSVLMASFADTISHQVNRTVVDKTGLPGPHDFYLEWTRDDAPASDDAAAPPLFTALQEQLGLKLVPARASVQVLVVDHVSMPAEDEN